MSSSSPAKCQLHVFLDIDETLVQYADIDLWNALSAAERIKYETVDHEGKGIFVMRPHLREFLDFLFENAKVSLWTLSDQKYAEFVAKHIVLRSRPKTAKLQHIYSSDTGTNEAEDMHGNSKDLNYIWYDVQPRNSAECNTILIDDNVNNALNPSNRRNAIVLPPFTLWSSKKLGHAYTDRSKDTALMDIVALLRRVLPNITNCYHDDRRWENIFSRANIEKYGIEDAVQHLNFKGQKVPAISVGLKRTTGGKRTYKKK